MSAAATTTASPEDISGGASQTGAPISENVGEHRAQGPPKSRLFPMGYKEAASQWWASISPATAEHRVLSFIPFLQQAPTHTQTGRVVTPPAAESNESLKETDTTQAAQVTARSVDDPYGPRTWRSSLVELSGKNRALNEFSVERVGEEVEENLVILHGYGAGLGLFYKNFEGLSRAEGWKLYALDLLGMGRSTRPPFRIRAKQRQEAITETENWFIDALEEWRVKRNIDQFTLLGHSLGGYMAVAYALKYPGRLNKLILASPVGIPEDPLAVSAEMPEPPESTLANEFTQDQAEIVQGSQNINQAGDNNNFLNARNKALEDSRNANAPPKRRISWWLTYLWDANVSPFSLVRWSGPLGPRLVSGWSSRRFSQLPEPEARALHDYVYSLFRLRGSGEYALAYVLAPGAYARSPLIRRIHGVGRQSLNTNSTPSFPLSSSSTSSSSRSGVSASSQSGRNPSKSQTQPSSSSSTIFSPSEATERGIPIVLMYGENDWMDVKGGYAAKTKIEEEKQRILKDATLEERQADRGSAKVIIIKNAGHHLYLDGWEEFNDVMLEEMRGVSKSK